MRSLNDDLLSSNQEVLSLKKAVCGAQSVYSSGMLGTECIQSLSSYVWPLELTLSGLQNVKLEETLADTTVQFKASKQELAATHRSIIEERMSAAVVSAAVLPGAALVLPCAALCQICVPMLTVWLLLLLRNRQQSPMQSLRRELPT